MNTRFIILFMLFANTGMADSNQLAPISALSGKQIAFARDKGNCLACHAIEDGELPGDIGPSLKNIPSCFKDKNQLRAMVWDATQFNPDTSMPPFGKNKILTETEIDAVVEYLWTL